MRAVPVALAPVEPMMEPAAVPAPELIVQLPLRAVTTGQRTPLATNTPIRRADAAAAQRSASAHPTEAGGALVMPVSIAATTVQFTQRVPYSCRDATPAFAYTTELGGIAREPACPAAVQVQRAANRESEAPLPVLKVQPAWDLASVRMGRAQRVNATPISCTALS